MPIYEYDCQSCKKTFEKLVKSMSSKDKPACPDCGSKQTSRKLSAFAAVASSAGTAPSAGPKMCGRCGGPGPCAM
jgi:putative FmdB family regulatory protein